MFSDVVKNDRFINESYVRYLTKYQSMRASDFHISLSQLRKGNRIRFDFDSQHNDQGSQTELSDAKAVY